MPENVEYITELIASYCHMGLSHSVLGTIGVNWFIFCSVLDINVANFYCASW